MVTGVGEMMRLAWGTSCRDNVAPSPAAVLITGSPPPDRGPSGPQSPLPYGRPRRPVAISPSCSSPKLRVLERSHPRPTSLHPPSSCSRPLQLVLSNRPAATLSQTIFQRLSHPLRRSPHPATSPFPSSHPQPMHPSAAPASPIAVTPSSNQSTPQRPPLPKTPPRRRHSPPVHRPCLTNSRSAFPAVVHT